MKILVFDLDDTLYEELTFVYGGLKAAAEFLSPIVKEPVGKIFQEFKKEEKVRREGVFDRFLSKRGIQNKRLVKQALSVYRNHTPDIALFPAVKRCLERYKHLPLYAVTDGNKVVQKRKFEALGLQKYLRHCFCTHAHGLHRKKPSSYCFEKILPPRTCPSSRRRLCCR
jgi:putative hydrolase of the HAD superfamily